MQRRPKGATLPAVTDLRGLGDRFSSRNKDLGGFLRSTVDDIKGYRERFKFISGSYEGGYNIFKVVIGQMNAQADSEQQIINLAFSFASNVAIGALGNSLQAANKISAAMNLYGGSAVNTATGLATPEIEKATIADDLHPAIKTAQGLQKLDELSQAVLPIAARGVDLLLEPAKLAERLAGEVRVAAAGGAREMTDDQVNEKYKELQEQDKKAAQLAAAVQDAVATFGTLRQAHWKAPWLDMMRCERDIWILWISRQNVAKYGMYYFGPLGRSQLHKHMIDIGLATEYIGTTPEEVQDPRYTGGELGAATKGLYKVINGQYVKRDGPQMLKDGAVARAPEVGKRWSIAMLSGS